MTRRGGNRSRRQNDYEDDYVPRGRGRGRGRGRRSDNDDGYRSESRRGRRGDRGGRRRSTPDRSLELCRNYTLNGVCQYQSTCHYAHTVQCVAYEREAHSGRVADLTHAPGEPAELFSVGLDSALRRWHLRPADDLLELSRQSSSQLMERVTMMHYDAECLYLGTEGGTIQVLHRASGEERILLGHKAAVAHVLRVGPDLISATAGGELKFWGFSQPQGTFVCVRTVDLASEVSALLVMDGLLWCAGAAIALIHLGSGQLARKLDLPAMLASAGEPPREGRDSARGLRATGLLRVEMTVLVSIKDGPILAVAPDGTQVLKTLVKHSRNDQVLGVVGPAGQYVASLGGNRLTLYKLPEFEPAGTFVAADGNAATVHYVEPHFIVGGGSDGSLSVFQLK